MSRARRQPRISDLPSAGSRLDQIRHILGDRRPALFLDYDGTLTPIVDDPADARLPTATREVIERLAARTVVAIISGRDLEDVRALVAIDGIWYAGSHGLDLLDPDGKRTEQAREFLPALASAEADLRDLIGDVEGARLERKRFAIAVHERQVPARLRGEVKEAVDSVAAEHPQLRVTGGKHIHELRPDIDWDKGAALRWLIDELELSDEAYLPVYIGDDETDEDAFRALGQRGLGLVVRGEDDARSTLADYVLADPREVSELLERMLGWVAPIG